MLRDDGFCVFLQFRHEKSGLGRADIGRELGAKLF